jgi:hypothetical protein
MTKDAITERLKFLTELLRFAFVALLAIGGGTLGLLLGPQDPLRLGFAIAGIVAKSDHTRLAHLCVTLSEAKGLKDQILRYAQNDNVGRLHRKVYECYVV